MLRDLHSEIVSLNLFSPRSQGSSTVASVHGNSHSRSLPLRQANTVLQLTVNSSEGLVSHQQSNTQIKLAKVTPIFKQGDRSDMNNYRPISVISGIAKVFERIIYNQPSSYLSEK